MRNYSENSLHSLSRLTYSICFGLLGLHLYVACYWLFDRWHLSSRFSDSIIYHIQDTVLLRPLIAKAIALLFLVLSVFTSSGQKQREFSRVRCLVQVLAGGLLYFTSQLIFARNGSPTVTCLSYLLATCAGFGLVNTGLSRILNGFRVAWDSNDPFGFRKGFPQEQRHLKSSFGLSLPAQFIWQGQLKDSWINLVNPRRGVLILGSAGSGKSYFIIEPLLRQWMEKGHVLFLYDFKYPALSKVAYSYFKQYQGRFPKDTGFFCINFSRLSHSHRCNVLQPSSLRWLSDALGASRTILLSMNKTWVHKQGEFFVESPVNFLGALIWYLRQYKNGIYCTLPHVIELAQLPYNVLFPILLKNQEIHSLVVPFAQAYQSKANDLLESQIASARIPLGRLASPDLYYVLTGDDLTLDINSRTAPRILCLAGEPSRQEALAPVLSLFLDQICRLCNQPERHPCALFCDEFATVRAYRMTNTIATARSNNIVPVLAVQDLSQLRTQYSRDEADLFMNISGNLICGQVGGETAKWVSDRFPKIQRERQAVAVNSDDTSVSTSQQWEPTVTPATIAGLSSGEFVGLVADEPGQEIELKGFCGRVVREGSSIEGVLPRVREVSEEGVMEVFRRVKGEVEGLMGEEMNKGAS